MIVNRHYSPESNFIIGLKDLYVYNNWSLINLTDEICTTLNKNSLNEAAFTETITAGDGKLYSLAPTVLYGGELTTDETISQIISLNGDLVIGNGKTLTINNTYNIYGDITIKNGGKLITNGNGELRFFNGKRIRIEGSGEISGTSTNKLSIIFNSVTGYKEIYAVEGTSLLLNNCRIENAVKGINYINNGMSEQPGSLTVTNCEFINCTTGVCLESLCNTIPFISNNTFTNCGYGVFSQNNTEVRITGNTINSLFGIWLTNTSFGIIDNNYFTPVTLNNGVGIYMNSSFGYLCSNTISNFYNGIFLGSSSPIIRENIITEQSSNGIYSGSGSSPHLSTSVVGGVIYLLGGRNYIENSGTVSNNIAEIYINNGNPNLYEGYNCIIDDRDLSSYLIDGYFERRPPTIQAQTNYWGNNGYEPIGRFGIDVDSRDWLDICSNNLEGGGMTGFMVLSDNGSRIIDTLYSLGTAGNLTEEEILESQAERKYVDQNYSEAVLDYLSIINSYGTGINSLRSYQRLYEIDRLTRAGTEVKDSRISLFQTKANQTTDTLLRKAINHLVSLYYVEKADYQTAIGRYEEIIHNSNNMEEVLFAEIDAVTTAYLSSQTQGMGKITEGKYFVKPNEDYKEKISNILSKKFSAFKSNKEKVIPINYGISQNYPNPFNPVTVINYQLPKDSKVNLRVYDILGKEVAVLVDETKSAGEYSVTFNASKLASGVYIYRIIAGDFVMTKKMNLVK